MGNPIKGFPIGPAKAGPQILQTEGNGKSMKLLISNRMRFSEQQLQRLRGLGFDEIYLGSADSGRCPEEYRDAEAAVCYMLFSHNDISLFPNLRIIHTTSSGIDHMPMNYIREHGIKLYNAVGVYSVPLAEFALCGVLQLYKHAPKLRAQQLAHEWKPDFRLLELCGKRVCIVGAGSIGTETAKRFSAMDCHVTGLCRHPGPRPYFDEVRHAGELDEVLPDSDVVILSLPLTDETRHLFDARRFARMKKGSVLVNIARGPVVDTAALLDAARDGTLMGAVVDVCETEPLPPDSPLWEQENIILTPHNSFIGDGNTGRMFELIYRNFRDYLSQQSAK